MFAATSLSDAFTELGEHFHGSHPHLELTFHFAGSQELRTQLTHGAAADVFASADRRQMDELRRTDRVLAPVVFAQNEPVIVVARESGASLSEFADLPRANRLIFGAPEVPIGRYTIQILDKASAVLGADFRSRVEAKVVSRELNVRQVLAKVTLGEADAGIVYRTDVRRAPEGVRVVAIPPEVNVIAEYPVAVVHKAVSPAPARAWIELLLSTEGQRILRAHGFVAPPRADSGP